MWNTISNSYFWISIHNKYFYKGFWLRFYWKGRVSEYCIVVSKIGEYNLVNKYSKRVL